MSSQTDSSTTIALTGSCQCGSVILTSTALPSSITLCHCVQCRKMSGTAFMPFGLFENSSLSWTGNTAAGVKPPVRIMASRTRKADTPIAYRGSCGNCGSPLWMKYSCGPQYTSVAMGIVNDDSLKGNLPKPKEHIFLKEKASWWELDNRDGLLRHETFDERFGNIMRKWEDDGCVKRNDVD